MQNLLLLCFSSGSLLSTGIKSFSCEDFGLQSLVSAGKSFKFLSVPLILFEFADVVKMIEILGKSVVGCGRPIIYCSSRSPRFFSDCKKADLPISPAILDLLLHKYQFSPPVASKVASVLTGVKHTQKCDSVLSFLKENGFSNAQLERMANVRPRILSAGLEKAIKPKLRVLHELGVPSNYIAHITSMNPNILSSNLNTRIIPRFNFLKDMLGTSDAVAKLWRLSPSLLFANLEREVASKIDFLKSWGIPREHVLKLLFGHPRCILLPPGILSKAMEKAEKMGVSRSSNQFSHAVRIIISFSDIAWELKLLGFQNCGFSESDLMEMFQKSPSMFCITPKRFKRAIDFLLATGKYNMSCIISRPQALGYSIEKRYMPRFQILEILERKNLIENWPSLSVISQMLDEKFVAKFVKPYLSEVKELSELSKKLDINRVKAPKRGTTGLQVTTFSDGNQ